MIQATTGLTAAVNVSATHPQSVTRSAVSAAVQLAGQGQSASRHAPWASSVLTAWMCVTVLTSPCAMPRQENVNAHQDSTGNTVNKVATCDFKTTTLFPPFFFFLLKTEIKLVRT